MEKVVAEWSVKLHLEKEIACAPAEITPKSLSSKSPLPALTPFLSNLHSEMLY
jgi:hypothetical protein